MHSGGSDQTTNILVFIPTPTHQGHQVHQWWIIILINIFTCQNHISKVFSGYHHSHHKVLISKVGERWHTHLLTDSRTSLLERSVMLKINFLLNNWGVRIILAAYSVKVSCCGIITTLSPQVISYLMSLIRIWGHNKAARVKFGLTTVFIKGRVNDKLIECSNKQSNWKEKTMFLLLTVLLSSY